MQVLGADGLLYQSIDDLLAVAQSLNPTIKQFEASCFTGNPLPTPRPLPPKNCFNGSSSSMSKRLASSILHVCHAMVVKLYTYLNSANYGKSVSAFVLSAGHIVCCCRFVAEVDLMGDLCCAGHYVTEDISPAYLQSLESSVRMQDRKRSGEKGALVA